MLCELRVRDFALIEDLTLEFAPGLNVITGETGAGKSIILQALALLCGGRGANELIRTAADDATIEGVFACAMPDELREALGLEGDEILVRRQLSRSGKSRVYVNGSPATLALLAQLGEHLVHIYGQHEQALLLRPGSHLDLLDRFAGLDTERAAMAQAYARFRSAVEHRDALDRAIAAAAERRDVLAFQHAELEAAAVQVGEEEALQATRTLLRHAGRVHEICHGGEMVLYSGESAIAGQLARLRSQLAEWIDIAPGLAAAAELLDGGRVQLEEAALHLRQVAAHAQADPEHLDTVEERLQLLGRLSRKHGLRCDELPARAAALAEELAALDGQDERARARQQDVDTYRTAALTLAGGLARARRAAARRLEDAMEAELAALGMGAARFQIAQQTPAAPDDAALHATGIDEVEFLLSANPGEEPRPLARIASGGELSRLMLGLKALTAAVGETPILIFDEVDAGVGGAVADAVGRRLKTLAQNRQLLCITHLPQIAAYADHHYAVEKHERRGRTITTARALTASERIAEVSRMLGGHATSAEAAGYAKRLLADAHRASTRSAELGARESDDAT